ncbi:MAG TPA: hypothetical protein VHN11_00460 [Xanthobacteraceae bacterium]|jgi:hypothetical protein|nr:hypothetical protein [Xanthobacteraceae bacterium]
MPQHSTQRQSLRPNEDCQRRATSSADVEQLDLLPRKKPSAPLDKDYCKALPSLRRAINYSLSLADMDPKEAYGPLEMDKAIWSRIANGGMSFPADDIPKLKHVTGNEAAIYWLAVACGYDLRPLRNELEQQLEDERAAHAETQRENELLRKLILERR